jgi:dethiobiotin synthase
VRGVFVTGTDTGIGKTVVSAALLYRFARVGPARYWKPIQTGIERDDDTATVVELSGCDRSHALDDGVRLPRPLSPHLAARLSGVTIAIDDLVRTQAARTDRHRWVVEGAGGVLVPINEGELIADLMAALALPVIVVARSALGTINHTLLTLEALRARSLAIAGVVMVGDGNIDNRRAIEHYGRVQVLGELPLLQPLTPSALQSAAGRLSLDDLLDVERQR